jgi:group I intron endonuclease
MLTSTSAKAQATSITSLPVICGVYCITHLATGRQYIGQSVDCVRRMLDHPRYNDSPIGKAIRHYGREAFRFEILNIVPRSELLRCEAGWIKILDTLQPRGFNVKTGLGAEEELTRRQRYMRDRRNARDRARAKARAEAVLA